MPRGRPKGSKNRTVEQKQATKSAVECSMAENDRLNDRKPYIMTPDLEAAIENAVVESPKPPKIVDHPFPSDWDKMSKVDRLKWLKNPK